MKLPKLPKYFKSVRYCLAAINSIFLITGLILLITGIAVLVTFNQHSNFITYRFFNLVNFTIATGVIIFLIGILGYYGAMSEKFYFIAGYVALLLVIIIFDIIITVLGFGLQDDATTEITLPMTNTMPFYQSNPQVNIDWDNLQMSFKCCGVKEHRDWRIFGMPISCCYIGNGIVSPFNCTVDNAYKSGCAKMLGDWLGYNAYVVGVIGAFATTLHILITVGAAWMAYRSRFEEVELES